jgi:hypothetical protein
MTLPEWLTPEAVWFGGIAVVVIFVLACAGYGSPWRKGGVFPSDEAKLRARRRANAIAERKDSAKRRLNK